MTRWHPMTEHKFPWPHERLLVAVFDANDPAFIDVLRVRVAEHGAMFIRYPATMLSILEEGWIPFAWKLDDTPDPNDKEFPPMWEDYLTKWRL